MHPRDSDSFFLCLPKKIRVSFEVLQGIATPRPRESLNGNEADDRNYLRTCAARARSFF